MLTRLRQSKGVRVVVRRIGVHRVMTVLTVAQWPVLKAVEALLLRRPRDAHVVAMGAPLDRFSDNAAYLFVHMSEHPSELEPVWVTGSREVLGRLQSRGYRAVMRWSWSGIKTTANAGTFIYSGYRSDINRWLASGAVTLSLWHGLPIKRIEAGVIREPRRRRSLLDRMSEAGREPPPDYLLSSSEFVTQDCFAPAFRIAPDRCWELGYPRNDHLLTHPTEPPQALVWHNATWNRLVSADRVVGLFLTWRDDRVDDAVDDELVRRISRLCGQHGSVLAYKAHYNVAPADVTSDDCVLIPTDADLHAYLGLCDILITDYSSVALDFLLMERPTVYYMPDMEEYAKTRGFYVDPLGLPGVVTRDAEGLLASLDSLLATPDEWSWSESDSQFRRKMWGESAGNAAQSVVNMLVTHLKHRGRSASGDPSGARATARSKS